MAEEPETLCLAALLLRVPEAFGRYSVISVCARPGQHVTDRIGPYQSQVSGAEFGLGVRWRLVLTSIGVPGPSLGNPPVVVFSLGLGGVPEGGPVAGQHSGTPCAGTREMGQCDRPLEPKTGTRNVRWVSNGSRACMRGLRGRNEVPSAGGQCLVQLVVGAYWSSPAGYSGRPGPGPALVVCGCVGA